MGPKLAELNRGNDWVGDAQVQRPPCLKSVKLPLDPSDTKLHS